MDVLLVSQPEKVYDRARRSVAKVQPSRFRWAGL